MDFKRNCTIFIFLILIVLFWYIWYEKSSNDLHKTSRQYTKTQHFNNINNVEYLKDKVVIQTDVLKLVINKYGGDIEKVDLLKYKKKLNSLNYYRLLDTSKNFIYQAQSGLIGIDGPDNPIYNRRPHYITSKNSFKLNTGDHEIRVPMTWKSKEGVVIVKTFIFTPKQYNIKVNFDIFNNTNKCLKVIMFNQLKQTADKSKKLDFDTSDNTFRSFRGAAFSTITDKFHKHNFNDILNNKNIYIHTKVQWISMLQQYFVTAWIPNNNIENTIYTNNLGNGIVTIGYKSNVHQIKPYLKHTIYSKLWVGPKIQDKMALTANNLELTIDYGWLWFLSQPLFQLLNLIHQKISNWGFSIILITFIMKAIMFPLFKIQCVSMTKMRTIQPEINIIKNKYKNDKKKLSQEIINLYKINKINPLGGCLPMLIQMPIFLALYYMLMGSVELRHAPFILWIHDLSNKDPYYILPILMGSTMLLVQKTSPNNITLDKNQQNIMNVMPLVLTTFFLWFPSGLVLYYIINNLLTVIQQWLVSYNFKK
ncbi:membrane protein insertase [Buchnera aphidicola (Nipponaphis monzeni)]|uniref:Membrane protein insertase YidC n=1 Tax=Buchnera aphidicola (Nipponaphis monzeni) TaxID=2495405 RepID=A0A455T9N9_9GAMM|nr:membrane protein insertase YidC [Buchnera aphidicola]BBI01033.1 membrane protein insertase [Buchnera aphidicola (Nipponaphis monzeni)]